MSVEKMEFAFIRQFGGEAADTYDLEKYEYRDIDVLLRNKDGEMKYWSVKNQDISQRTGNLSFELELINERTGATRPGNYALCEADKYAIACWWKGKKVWWIAEVSKVKAFVGMGEKDWMIKGLTAGAVASNRGRTYNQSRSIIVPLADLVAANVGYFRKIKA